MFNRLHLANCNIANANPPSFGTFAVFKGSILVQFQRRVCVSDPRNILEITDASNADTDPQTPQVVIAILHLPICERSAAAAGEDAAAGSLLPRSEPVHFPVLWLRHGKKLLGAIYCLPAALLLRISPGDQQVRRKPVRVEYLCFPVSCVRRRCIPQ